MFKQIEEEVEYHIHSIVDDVETQMMVTYDRDEAELWFERGKIVYEYRSFATQADWISTHHQTVYEWH